MMFKVLCQAATTAAGGEAPSILSIVGVLLQAGAAGAVIYVVMLFLSHLKALAATAQAEREAREKRETEQRQAEVKAREELANTCHEQHKELTAQCMAQMKSNGDIIERNTVAHARTVSALERLERATK